jgi:hypothetical protein
MVNVSNVDDLIAIVSVIRPGAANNLKKEQFALQAQELEPADYGTIESSIRNRLSFSPPTSSQLGESAAIHVWRRRL